MNGQVEVTIKNQDEKLCSISFVDFSLTSPLTRPDVDRETASTLTPTISQNRQSQTKKSLLVLGASSGLFRAMRKPFEEAGFSLITVSRRDATFKLDFETATPDDWYAIVNETRPFGVIHFASALPIKSPIINLDLGAMTRNMKLLAEPIIYCARAMRPLNSSSDKTRRRIIAITSSWARHLFPEKGFEGYSYAKTFQTHLIKDLARDLASSGITVNAVAPSEVAVGMNAHISDRAKAMLETVEVWKQSQVFYY